MKKNLNVLLSLILVFLICMGSVQANAAAVYRDADAAGRTADSQTDEPGGAAETAGLVGIWKMVEMTGDSGVSREDLKQYEDLGLVGYLEIFEDGTLMMSLFREETGGTWDESTITFGGPPCPYKVEGDTLTVEGEDGSAMILERSTKEAIDEIMGYKEGVLDEEVSYSEEEQTIVDTDDASITITGYKADKTGFRVFLRCENKTDKKLLLTEDTCVINKFVISPSWALDLKAKETKESEMVFSPIELEKCGVSAVDEMILVLNVMDSENYSILYEDNPVNLYPTGKKAEDIQAAERTPAEKELVVIDSEECTFAVESVNPGYSLGYAVNCYCENKTKDTLTFMMREAYIDEQDVSVIFAQEILPGTRGYSDAVFLSANLEEKGIKKEEIKKIRATVRVYDSSLNTVAEKEFTYEP